MYLHIDFKDGSNPFVALNLNYEELVAQVKKWEKKYIVNGYWTSGGGFMATATEKEV